MGFFFKFCDIVEVAIVYRQFSQIWIQKKNESKRYLTSFYIWLLART
jgi:hypothetical protein